MDRGHTKKPHVQGPEGEKTLQLDLVDSMDDGWRGSTLSQPALSPRVFSDTL